MWKLCQSACIWSCWSVTLFWHHCDGHMDMTGTRAQSHSHHHLALSSRSRHVHQTLRACAATLLALAFHLFCQQPSLDTENRLQAWTPFHPYSSPVMCHFKVALIFVCCKTMRPRFNQSKNFPIHCHLRALWDSAMASAVPPTGAARMYAYHVCTLAGRKWSLERRKLISLWNVMSIASKLLYMWINCIVQLTWPSSIAGLRLVTTVKYVTF